MKIELNEQSEELLARLTSDMNLPKVHDTLMYALHLLNTVNNCRARGLTELVVKDPGSDYRQEYVTVPGANRA